MNLKIKKFDKINRLDKKLIIVLLILELDFFKIIKIPIFDNLNTTTNKMLIMSITIIYVALEYFIIHPKRRLLKYNRPLFNETIILIFFLSVQAIYTLGKYDETIMDVFIGSGHLLLILLSFVWIRIFVTDKNITKFLDFINLFVVFGEITFVINSILITWTGSGILYYKIFEIRNGIPRIQIPSFFCVMILYSFFQITKGDKLKRNYFNVLIGLVCVFRFDMSRMLQIAMIVSMFSIMFFREKITKRKIILTIIFIIIFIFLIKGGLLNIIAGSFSVTGDRAGSTLARLNSIQYFKKFTDDNFFLGMGIVRPYTPELTAIYFGPAGSYNCLDDIGIYGLFFYYGFIGLLLYICMIIRMFYILIKIKLSPRKDNYSLLIGIFIFILMTSTTLIITNSQRCFMIPLILAIFEYSMYICSGDIKEV